MCESVAMPASTDLEIDRAAAVERTDLDDSWDLFARYVIPELRGMTTGLRESQVFLHEHRAELMGGAGRAIMAKVMENEPAADAMKITAERNQRRAAAQEQSEFRPGPGLPTEHL